jgi:hypothetical protein
MFDLDEFDVSSQAARKQKATDNRTTLAMNREVRGKVEPAFCMYDVSAAQPYELFAEF